MTEGAVESKRLTFPNQFRIGSRWNPREESPEELGRRTLRCLDAISPLHPAFRDWECLNLVRPADEMTEENYREFFCPLDKARPRMTDFVVEWGVSVTDFDGPDPREGYGISVGNSNVADSEHVTLGAHGGGLVSWTDNFREASFETSLSYEADPTIVAYPVFKSVLMAIISSWNVDFASAGSSDLSKLPMGSHYFCGLSWMVYLSAPLARRISIPTDVTVERTPDGGILMIAAEETFDVKKPHHVARARSILSALSPLNAEEAARLAQFNTWRPPKRGGSE
jgi:Immunity protein 52